MPDQKESSPEQFAVTAAPVLATPCTLLQLHQWIKAVDAVRPGNNSAAVTAAATSITVA